MTGPCDWPISYIECQDITVISNLSEGDRGEIEGMAVSYLWNWTGRKFGPCQVLLRPCRQRCVAGSRSPWTPVLTNGQWYNIACGACGSGNTCGCDNTSSITLGWPVASVETVTVDGVALDPAAYRLDNGHLLVRTDGGRWPTCQNLSAADTETGTWSVLFTRGIAVPSGGQIAAGLLALEMAKAICNDGSCKLPQRIQTITRQGITISLVDDFKGLTDKGRTGLWLVDSWVSSVMTPRIGATVRSPDVPRARHSSVPVIP